MVTDPTAEAVNPTSPLPPEPSPMAVLVLVQEKPAPGVPEKATATGLPAQASKLAGWFTTGDSMTVMSKF